jgi:hypothetical protein
MRLTIVAADSAVYVDGMAYVIPTIDNHVPAGVSALQWDHADGGWVEFNEVSFGGHKPANQRITELPVWAVDCQNLWDGAHAAQEAVDLLQEQDMQAHRQPIGNVTSTGTQEF